MSGRLILSPQAGGSIAGLGSGKGDRKWGRSLVNLPGCGEKQEANYADWYVKTVPDTSLTRTPAQTTDNCSELGKNFNFPQMSSCVLSSVIGILND